MKGRVDIPPPLFDRLVDGTKSRPRDGRPLRSLDRSGLLESVQRELGRLLNTRIVVPADQVENLERTTIDYGLPDLALFGPLAVVDRQRLGLIIQRTIEAFEPRLANVVVTIDSLRAEDQALWARLDGTLLISGVPEPVSFPAVLRPEPGSSVIYASE